MFEYINGIRVHGPKNATTRRAYHRGDTYLMVLRADGWALLKNGRTVDYGHELLVGAVLSIYTHEGPRTGGGPIHLRPASCFVCGNAVGAPCVGHTYWSNADATQEAADWDAHMDAPDAAAAYVDTHIGR